ncbi:MAG TPA: DUF1987 domain-containing protein [Tenuifilaceae bacterium]|nr:DUF1987 domain-containing protein [Tenuifilaceae bacterium]HPE17587.1 DUF1987 domain-containing protein [Tenuifilaceae bacterium]HPJ45951.1 DUF1987 domain-containing protein [Tenuifilaceae bacterium]HPQ34295.1 DUF1987 domain-containing protein [Tenuifilaceae bacterium]HRX67963.1 DUF1987 domain-containing protein [Tenuifilaceae bacterium]
MQKFEIKETGTTPYVLLDNEKGEFIFEGRSIPENVIEFFQPIIKWIEEYSQNPQNETKVTFKLEYFNTSSSKRIFDVMKRVENITVQTGMKVTIYWYYEEDDEDIFFAGSDYKALITKVDFNLVEE